MVCPYCQSKTQVYNSRKSKSHNSTWRRRKCQSCGATFSTLETMNMDTSIMFKTNSGALEPFARAKLFVSIYEACKHLKHPEISADSLTDTIVNKLDTSTSVIVRQALVQTAYNTLKAFNNAAAVAYIAFHPL